MAQNRAVSTKAEELKLSPERIHHYQTDKTICTDREAISRLTSKLNMQKEIAKHPAETSLPVILQILIDIKTALFECQSPELSETTAIVEQAITIFGETDKVQRSKLSVKHAYIKNLLEEAKVSGENPFVELERLVNEIDKLEMTENTTKLWNELAIWMEGLYKKTADRIKARDADNEPVRDKKGCYPTVDTEDWGIWMLFGITKMDISINYHRAAMKLDDKIAKFQLVRKASMPGQAVAQQNAAAMKLAAEKVNAKQVAEEAAVVDGSIDYTMQVAPSSSEGFITLTIEIPQSNAEYGQVICETIQEMFANPLANELRKYAGQNEDVRISNFESLLEQFGLSEMQKINLRNFRKDAKTVLHGYTDPTTLSIVNPTRLFGRGIPGLSFLDKTNASLAETAASDLNIDDVTQHFMTMIQLRRDLQGTHSTSLRPAVTKLLIDAIERISSQAPVLKREISVPDLSKTVLRMK